MDQGTAESLGKLLPEERALLDTLTSKASQIANQIGYLEVQKARLIAAVSSVEEKADDTLKEVAKRLSIPEGRQWHVAGEEVFLNP